MLVEEIIIRQLRLFKELQLAFSPHLNVLAGPNAIGKTTVLEAIYLLVTGRSFRTTHITELVKTGFDKFFMEARYQKNNIEQTVRLLAGESERTVMRFPPNRENWSALVGLLLGAVLTPADAELIKGSPQVRRHYLDLQISQTDPLYVHHLVRYSKAMGQRNALLKKRQLQAIFPWEKEMAASGAYLTSRRKLAVEKLMVILLPLHKELAGDKEAITLNYSSRLKDEAREGEFKEAFEAILNKNRVREVEIGHTIVGPHKDDLEILLNGMPARFYGSEGQQRAAAATLKFAEWSVLKEESGVKPLMLIDDFALSYDNPRRERLLHHIQNLGQVFITTNQEDLFDPKQACVHRLGSGM